MGRGARVPSGPVTIPKLIMLLCRSRDGGLLTRRVLRGGGQPGLEAGVLSAPMEAGGLPLRVGWVAHQITSK